MGAGVSDFVIGMSFRGCPLTELDSPIAKMVYLSGSAFSHFGFRTLRIIGVTAGARGRFMVISRFCMSGKFVSEFCIFDNISKQLHVDNEGVLVTCCFVQNPPLVW